MSWAHHHTATRQLRGRCNSGWHSFEDHRRDTGCMGRSMRYRVFGPGLSGRFLKTAWAVLVIPGVLACGLFSGDPAPSPTLPPNESPTATDEGSPKGEPGTGMEFEPKATPFPTATPYPTATPFPTATPYPTPAPLPTASPTPTPGAGPSEATPVVTPAATPVSAASPTPTPAAGTSSPEATATPASGAAPVVSSPVAGPTPTAVVAAPPGPSTGTTRFTLSRGPELKHPKVGSLLDDLIAGVQAGEISAEEAAQEAPLHRGDSIGVAIHLSGNVESVVRFLESNGASNIFCQRRLHRSLRAGPAAGRNLPTARSRPRKAYSTSGRVPERVWNPRQRPRCSRLGSLEPGRVHGQWRQGGGHRQWIRRIRRSHGYGSTGKCPGQMLPVAG